MKSFKNFIKKKEISWLDIPAFSEVRENNKKNKEISWLNFDGSFASIRDKHKKIISKISENESPINWKPFTGKYHRQQNCVKNSQGVLYDKHLDSEGIVPDDTQNFRHKRYIYHYTATKSADTNNGHRSSSNINNHLRWLAGQKVAAGGENTQGIVGGHSPEKVKRAIKQLSATFHSKSVNREPIQVYSGVPRHIGEQIEASGSGAEHRTTGFLSTSTEQAVAKNFATDYADQNGDAYYTPLHVLQIHAHPGSVRSVAQHSHFDEHEALMHFGTKLRYSHTSTTTSGMHTIKIHHMEAFPDRLSLEDYPKK